MPKIQLTDRSCKSARPIDGQQTDYFDTHTTGLSLRVGTDTKAFYLNFTRPNGKRGRMKLGRYPEELSLSKAREKAKEARGQVIDGNDPIADKKALVASQTVSDLVENYIARHAMTKRSGLAIARRLRRNVYDIIGDIKLADLHRRDLTKCIDAVKDRGANIEANRVFEDIRSMVRWARGRGDLDENLVEGMRKPSEAVVRDRWLTGEEIKTMWEALPDADMLESTRHIIRLCLVTGQRVGEISGMTKDELALDKAIWTIPASRSKNGQEHTVPLSTMALDIIREQIDYENARAPSAFVFPAPDGREALRGVAVWRAVKRDEDIFGIEPWTPHDLRRTAATGMEELGVLPFVVGHVLNHISITKSSVTSRHYARYSYDKEKRDALNLWAARLAGIIAGGAEVIPLRK